MVKLYGFEASPPFRAVKLTLAALEVPYEFVPVELAKGEHLKPEFLKKNPTHTVPVLEDDGVAIGDSHAIICYLASKYGKTDALYPKDLVKRAVVDQRLHFESGVVFANALRTITVQLIFSPNKTISKERIKAIADVYDFTESFLKDSDYVAGNQLTLADFSLISTISSLVAFLPLDAGKHPKVTAWVKRLEQLPYYEQNAKGAADFHALVKGFNFTLEA